MVYSDVGNDTFLVISCWRQFSYIDDEIFILMTFLGCFTKSFQGKEC